MARAHARMLRVDDLRLAGYEPLQKTDFFIVDGAQVLGAEETLDHGVEIHGDELLGM